MRFTINDNDREDFVRNNESFYKAWRRTMGGERKLREFVRANRAEIDAAIQSANKPPRALEDEPYYMRGRGATGPMTSPAPVPEERVWRRNRYGHRMIGRAGQSLLPR